MTVNIICDYCGDPIDGPRIDLESDKHFSRGGRWAEGTFGNFHNTDECFGQIGEAIRAHLTARPGLAAIPVLDEEPPVADSACDDAPDTPPIADRGPQPIVDVALKCSWTVWGSRPSRTSTLGSTQYATTSARNVAWPAVSTRWT